ncbi:DNA-binding helix-turn-helix protein [Leptospira yanagawae serovar Saopaulo str. Sao Paulo = ATCC 700523]|uniref:DNA-binding helix-turn-helix protein n=1 Tax=Leptospira yanagawae serovar Saopaulo str. Sao Paulo = ATCC 700523 TaxID=1249483 RepID=A0A5E8HBS0_9LEPT|nr:helix-turn-helix transcriptional regulator [Leptospira yanagawae]EOQ87466.1 DNA-binding helix-turn-helix protein [Leptospira yanagawae serovar Saopaulo str. Sao Paulo = ATCC 700523]
MDIILERITFASGGLSFLLLLTEIGSRGKHPWRLYLVLIYFVHSFFMLLGWSIISNQHVMAAHLVYFTGPMMFVHAWALPRSLRCIANLSTSEELSRNVRSVLYQLRFHIFFFGISGMLYALNFENRHETLVRILTKSNLTSTDYFSPTLLIFAQIFQIYGLFVTIYRAKTKLGEKSIKVVIVICIVLIIRTFFALLERIFMGNEYLHSHLFASAITIPIFFIGYKLYLNYLIKSKFELTKPYKYSRLSDLDLDILETKLTKVMELDRLYQNENLNLPELADKIEVTTHQLSEYLNVKKGISFRQYLNEYRLNMACKLLETEPQKTILEIALECGFNAKSTFHSVFQKSLGLNPSEYRKKFDPTPKP